MFPYISDFKIEFIREEYNKTIKEQKLLEPLSFGNLLDCFIGTQIDTTDGRLRFSHSSYRERFNHRFTDEKQSNQMKLILNELLMNFSLRPGVIERVAVFFRANLEKTTEPTRRLLLPKLLKNQKAMLISEEIIERYFDSIEKDLRDFLLLELAEKLGDLGYVNKILSRNIDKIDAEIVGTLLERLVINPHQIYYAATILKHHFNKIPEGSRNEIILKAIADNNAIDVINRILEEHQAEISSEVRNKVIPYIQKVLAKRALAKNILLVEDDKPTRRTFVRILKQRGYVVDFAETWEDALEKVENRDFDLALIDDFIQDRYGIELLSILKKQLHSTAKILMLCLSSRETIDQAINEGLVDAYLVKPFTPQELFTLLEEKLNMRLSEKI